MSQSKYIKVTPKGGKEGRVVLASLKSFFVSQGAKIEEPTPKEIAAEFPEERKTIVVGAPAQPQPAVNATIAEQKVTIEKQAETIKALEEELKTAKEEREKAWEQVAALGKSLEESEQLIAKLRADAEKGTKTSGKEKGE